MKKVITLAFAAVMMTSFAAAQAGNTATGTLTVKALVNSSITIAFVTDAKGVTLAGSGTDTATLDFGTVQAFGGTLANNVTRTTTATNFTVSSPVDVEVDSFNSSSANYNLTAKLNGADAFTWSVGGVAVNNTGASPITATGTYGAKTNFPVAVTIPFTTPSGTPINNSINYTATSN